MSVTVYRPVEGRIEVSRMPAPREGEPTNREWFKEVTGMAVRPEWVTGPSDRYGHWELARQHFMTLARALAMRFGRVELVMEFNEHERCDRRCQEATGDDCTCSCLGQHHRGGVYRGWVEVGETTLVRSRGVKQTTATLTRLQVQRGA